MPNSPTLSPDTPELRLIAQLAGIAPSKLAAAINNPQHWNVHLTRDHNVALMDAFGRLDALAARCADAVHQENQRLKTEAQR